MKMNKLHPAKITFKIFVFLMIAMLAFGNLGVTPSMAGAPKAPLLRPATDEVIPDQYIVIYKRNIVSAQADMSIRASVEANGGQVEFVYTSALKGFSAYLPEAALNAVRSDPNVAYVEPDVIISLSPEEQGDVQEAGDVAAEDVTRITHGFDECIESSQASSALIYLLLSGMDKTNALELIKERYGNIVDEALGQMDQKDVWGGGAVTTLGVALKSYELNNKPKEVILGAVNAQMSKWCKVENWSKNPGPSGPDTDSYAILAAAFVAAEFIGQQRIGELQKFVSEMLPKGQGDLLDPLTPEIIEQRVKATLIS